MKNRSKFVRIVALILALLMFGSVLIVAIQSVALSPASLVTIPAITIVCLTKFLI